MISRVREAPSDRSWSPVSKRSDQTGGGFASCGRTAGPGLSSQSVRPPQKSFGLRVNPGVRRKNASLWDAPARLPAPRHASSSLPAPCHATGSLPAPCHATGSLSAPRHASGSLPAPRHATGSLPAPRKRPCYTRMCQRPGGEGWWGGPPWCHLRARPRHKKSVPRRIAAIFEVSNNVPWPVLGVPWACPGRALGVSRACPGRVLGASWGRPEGVLGASGGHPGDLGPPQNGPEKRSHSCRNLPGPRFCTSGSRKR